MPEEKRTNDSPVIGGKPSPWTQEALAALKNPPRGGSGLQPLSNDQHIYHHSDTAQNSVEIGQTSKGQWYVKSVKLYSDEDTDSVRDELQLLAGTVMAVVAALNT